MMKLLFVALLCYVGCANRVEAASGGETADFASVCQNCKDGDEESCLLVFATNEQKSNNDCVGLECEDSQENCDLIKEDCFQTIQELPAPVVFFRQQDASAETFSAITGADLPRLADATHVSEVAVITGSTALTLRDCQTLLQLLAEGAPNIDTKVMSGTPARFAYDSAKQTCYLLVKDGELGEDVSEPPAKVTLGLEHCEGANSACRACQKDGKSDSCEELFSTDESKSNLDCKDLCKKGFCDVIDKARCFSTDPSFSTATKVATFNVVGKINKQYSLGNDDLEGFALSTAISEFAMIRGTNLAYRDCQTILQLILQHYSDIEKKEAIESKPTNFVFDKNSQKCYFYGNAGVRDPGEISKDIIVGEPYCTGANPTCRACAGGDDETCKLLYSTNSEVSNLECKQECSAGSCEKITPEGCLKEIDVASTTKVVVFTLNAGRTERKFGFKKAELEALATTSGVSAIADITSEADLDVRDCQTLLQLVSGDANVNSMNGTPESFAFDDKNKECFLLGTGGSDAAEAKTPAQAIVGSSHCDGANAVCRKCKNENNATSCQLLFALEGSAVSNVDCEKGDCDTGHCDTVKEECFEEKAVPGSTKVSVFTVPGEPKVVSGVTSGGDLETGVQEIQGVSFTGWRNCQTLLQLVSLHKEAVSMTGDPKRFAFDGDTKTCYFLTEGDDGNSSEVEGTNFTIGPQNCKGCSDCDGDGDDSCTASCSTSGDFEEACEKCATTNKGCGSLFAIDPSYANSQCKENCHAQVCDYALDSCTEANKGLPQDNIVNFTIAQQKKIYRVSKSELSDVSEATGIDFTGINDELQPRDCQTLLQLLSSADITDGVLQGAPGSFAFDKESNSCFFLSDEAGSPILDVDPTYDDSKILTSGPTYCDGENAAVNTEEVCKGCSNSSCSTIYAVVPDKTNKDCELACDTESCDLVDASCFSGAQDFPANSSVISFEFPTSERVVSMGAALLGALQSDTNIDDLHKIGNEGVPLAPRDCQTVLQLLSMNKEPVAGLVNVMPEAFIYDNYTDGANPSCVFTSEGGTAIGDLGGLADPAESLVGQSLLTGSPNCQGSETNVDVASTCSKCTSSDDIAEACRNLYAVESNSAKSNYDCASDCDVSFCDFEDEECFSSEIPDSAMFILLGISKTADKLLFEIAAEDLSSLKVLTTIDEFGEFDSNPLTDRDCQTVLQLLRIKEGNIPNGVVSGNPSGFAFDNENKRCFITAEDGKTLAELDSTFTVNASEITGGLQTCSGINDDSDFSGVCNKCGAGDVASCSDLFATDSGSFNSNCTGVTCELDTCDLAEKQCFTDGDFPDKSAVVFTMTSYTDLFKIAQDDVGELESLTQIDNLAAAVTSMSPRDCQTLLQMVAINSKVIPAGIMHGSPSQFVYDSEAKACVLLGEGGSDADSLSYEFKNGTLGPRNCDGASTSDGQTDQTFASVCEACKNGETSFCALLYSVNPEVTNTDCATGDCEMRGCDLAEEDCFVDSITEIPEGSKAVAFELSDNDAPTEEFALKSKDLPRLAGAADLFDFSSITNNDMTTRDCQTLLQLLIANLKALTEKKVLVGTPSGFVFDSAEKACIITGDGGRDLDYPLTKGVSGPPYCVGVSERSSLIAYASSPGARVSLILWFLLQLLLR